MSLAATVVDNKVEALDACMSVDIVLVTAPPTVDFFNVNVWRATGTIIGGFPVLESVGVLSFAAEEEAEEEDAGDPLPEAVNTAFDEVVGCMQHPATSPVTRNSNVALRYDNNLPNGWLGAHSCAENTIYIAEEEIERTSASLLHVQYEAIRDYTDPRFIHADLAAKYGCDHAQNHAYVYTVADVEYRDQFGVRSPRDDEYDSDKTEARHAPIDCGRVEFTPGRLDRGRGGRLVALA